MPQNPNPLDAQIIARVRQFLQSTEISQRELCRMVGSDPGNFSAFLSGVKTLSVTKMHKLLQVLNFNRMQLEKKFNTRRLTSHILELTENGQRVSLDHAPNPGWVAGMTPEPENGSITDDYSPARGMDDLNDDEFLASLKGLHQDIIDRIDARQAMANPEANPEGIEKAVVNKGADDGAFQINR